MKKLAARIGKELKSASHCGVYEPELARVWSGSENREAQIALFARKHGWRLRHYKDGFCAIFDKDPSSPKRRTIRKILAGLIKRELQVSKYGHCAVYEDELQRAWPIHEQNRKAKLKQFANENGFRLVYYKPGLCAIFEEESVNKKS